MKQIRPPTWVKLDDEWDVRDLVGTELSFEGIHHLKKTKETVSTLAYLNRRTPILVEYKVFNKLVDAGFDLVPERDNKSVYEPAKLVGQLARYGRRPDTSKVDRDVLRQAMAITFRAFGGDGSLTPLPLDENLSKVIKMDKSSGLPMLTEKGVAFSRDLARAIRVSEGTSAPLPCVAYHRIQHGENGPKTRLVWGYPQSMTLLEGKFAPTLIDSFLLRKTPMVFGLNKCQVFSRMLRIRNSWLRYSLDFSGFDSSISAEWIDFAFMVLRTHFTFQSDEDEVVWNKIINYFIHTPIMLPDTSVWRKHHGVPSGSFFTQLIDSIVNYLAINYAWIRATGRAVQDGRALVLGDDSLVGQSKYVPVEVLQSYMSELGLTLNTQKTQVSQFRKGDPHFLGHYWSGGFPYRPLQEIAIRMAFPEKPSGIHDASERSVVRALSYLADSLNAVELVMLLAPAKSHWLEQAFASFGMHLDLDREIKAGMRPGLQAHLEEEGVLEAVTPYALISSQPTLGPWM